eukprot:358587-Chlamydomonas_euryale.AAC.2
MGCGDGKLVLDHGLGRMHGGLTLDHGLGRMKNAWRAGVRPCLGAHATQNLCSQDSTAATSSNAFHVGGSVKTRQPSEAAMAVSPH